MNTIGHIFRLTSFGESHGPAIGGVIDGMPAGIAIDLDAVQRELHRRRPGQSELTTARSEADKVEILSGLYDGRTTGTPIGFVIRNTDHRSADYDAMASGAYRPSHADFAYDAKYGIRDPRGGGRSSARETAVRVVAGAFARQVLAKRGISIAAYTSQVGPIALNTPYTELNLADAETNPVRCPDPDVAEKMRQLILDVRAEGDTVGGVATCVVSGVPAGLGEPVFDKLHAMLGAAMLSINAAKGFDYGMGFAGAAMRGSQVADPFDVGPDGKIYVAENHSGGIQGGISNGCDIYMRVVFKPVATLMREVESVDRDAHRVVIPPRGRHDPCVVPRAVPVVEAMAAITILDALLLAEASASLRGK